MLTTDAQKDVSLDLAQGEPQKEQVDVRSSGGSPLRRALLAFVLASPLLSSVGCDMRSSEERQREEDQQRQEVNARIEKQRHERKLASQRDLQKEAQKLPPLLEAMRQEPQGSVEYIQAFTEAEALIKILTDWNKRHPAYAVQIPGAKKPATKQE